MTLHLKKRIDQLELKLREHLDDSLQSIESRVSQDFQAGDVLVLVSQKKHKTHGLYSSKCIYIYIHYIYMCVCFYAQHYLHI